MNRIIGPVLLLVGLTILRAEEPIYPHGAFEGDCTDCHAASAWTPVTISPEFDHAAHGFALEGAHGRAACRACHATLDFSVADSDCVSCHLDPHESELGLDCAICHTPRSFIDRSAMLRGHLATRLPLDGRHRTIDCEECHALDRPGTLQFVGLPVDCYDCHADDLARATAPDHTGPGFSRQCDRCHTARAWEPARFNHGELPGGTQCADCHLDDYQATDDPDHEAVGFSLRCQDCHDTRAWKPATFDHDSLFPIDSGRHRNEWNECSDCHVDPSNYSVFSCLDCHAHDDPVDLAGKHDAVSGYSYSSSECYACHPDGEAED